MGYYVHDILIRLTSESSDVSSWDFPSLLNEPYAELVDEVSVDYMYGDQDAHDDDDFNDQHKNSFTRRNSSDSCNDDHLRDHDCDPCEETHLDEHECDDCDRFHVDDLEKENSAKLEQWLHHADWCSITNEWECGCKLNNKLDEMNIRGLMTNG